MLASESVLAWIIIGAIAGWLAGVMVKGYGFGSSAISSLASLAQASPFGLYTASTGGNIVAATVGALILLFLIGLVHRPGSPHGQQVSYPGRSPSLSLFRN